LNGGILSGWDEELAGGALSGDPLRSRSGASDSAPRRSRNPIWLALILSEGRFDQIFRGWAEIERIGLNEVFCYISYRDEVF
jgi:hypothetical protein